MYMCPRSALTNKTHIVAHLCMLLYYNLAFGRTRSICAQRAAPDCNHIAKPLRYNPPPPPPTPPHLRSVMFSEMSLFHLSAQHKCRGRTGPRLVRSFDSAFWPSGERLIIVPNNKTVQLYPIYEHTEQTHTPIAQACAFTSC